MKDFKRLDRDGKKDLRFGGDCLAMVFFPSLTCQAFRFKNSLECLSDIFVRMMITSRWRITPSLTERKSPREFSITARFRTNGVIPFFGGIKPESSEACCELEVKDKTENFHFIILPPSTEDKSWLNPRKGDLIPVALPLAVYLF